MLITNSKVYDTLKLVALVILPAFGTLYFALAQIWQFGYGTSVVGTITVIDTFLGGLLHVSNQTYQSSDAAVDGTMNVVETDTKKTFDLSLNGDPEDLQHKDKVVFKVNK